MCLELSQNTKKQQRNRLFIKITMIEELINSFNLFHFAVICTAFFLGGLVKGTSSFGLPTVSVPILITVLPLPAALSVLAVPLVLSNLFQMISAGGIKHAVKRHWSLYVTVLATLPVGVYLLAIADVNLLTVVLGIVLMIVTSFEIFGIPLTFLKNHEKFYAPIIGILSGIIGGMTSLFAILPIFFMVALGLEKERFVSAVSVMLCTGSLVLAISLQRTDNLGSLEVVYGVLGMLPIISGIWLGTQLRKKVDQMIFRKIVLSLIFIIGISMVVRSYDVFL